MTAATCPSAEAVRQFLLGQTQDPAADELARHFAGCPSCAQSLEGLKADDTLLDALRSADTLGDGVSPEVEQFIERFRRLPELDAGSKAGGGEGTAPPEPKAAELAAFLAPALAADEIGRLGSYRVLRLLGAGGMGLVFLGEDTKLRRRVALKTMRPDAARNPIAKDRFLREARLMASIEHDHIVPIFQVDEANSVPYLAMPLLKGEPLDALLHRQQRLPAEEVIRIGREIADGLAAAHAEGLIHRDI
jgi:hypothetical protein